MSQRKDAVYHGYEGDYSRVSPLAFEDEFGDGATVPCPIRGFEWPPSEFGVPGPLSGAEIEHGQWAWRELTERLEK